MCLYVLAILSLLLGSSSLYEAIETRTLRLLLYDEGLIFVQQTSLQAISWRQVQAVWHQVIDESSPTDTTPSTRHIYTVSCTDGTKMIIGKTYQLEQMERIGLLIEKATARYLFLPALNTYQMGQPVLFGPLMVNREGLSHRSQMLLWSEVRCIKRWYGTIVIKKQGKWVAWASVNLAAVPNVEVFKRLVQHVIAEAARQLFPAILNRYQMGQPVVFGSLTVTREGLSHRSQRLPWTRIKRRSILANEISESRLVIREPGKRFAWASVNLDALQVEVFWMLVDHMRGVSLSGV